MNKIIDFNRKEYLVISITIAISIALLPQYFLAIFLIIYLLRISYKSNKSFILSFSTISFLSLTNENLEDYRVYINLFITIILLAAFLSEYGLEISEYPRLPRELIYFLSFLFFTLVISSIFSSHKVSSFIATVRMISFLIIFYLIYALIKNLKDIYIIVYSLVFVMIISFIPILIDLSNLGIQNYLIRSLLVEKYDVISERGYTGVTLFFITLNLLIALFIKNNNKNTKKQIFIVLLIINNISLLLLANSRGGILASFISLTVMLLIMKPKLFYYSIIVLTTIFISFYVSDSYFRQAFELYMRWDTISDRLVYWNMGLEIINDNPIFGIGADTFDKYFLNYSPSSTVQYFESKLMNLGKPHPHNFFIYFFAENGIFGLLTAIYFFIIFFYYSIVALKLSRELDLGLRVLIVAVFSLGFGIFVRSFFEVTGYLQYGFLTRDLPFWLLFAILLKIHSHLKTINLDHSGRTKRLE